MGKDKNNITHRRFAELAKLGEQVFHAGDLAVLWQIDSPNTLYVGLKRYTDAGLLFRVFKGLYSIKPVHEVDPVLLGMKAIHRYAYISTETVLVRHGVIMQAVQAITMISSISKTFKLADHHYRCRRLSNSSLYDKVGIELAAKINVASLERAVADMLHFKPGYHFDNPKAIHWDKVKKIQQHLCYVVT